MYSIFGRTNPPRSAWPPTRLPDPARERMPAVLTVSRIRDVPNPMEGEPLLGASPLDALTAHAVPR
jgi:hypothetical protein